MIKRIKKWASQWPLWGWAWIATHLVLWGALVLRPSITPAVALIGPGAPLNRKVRP